MTDMKNILITGANGQLGNEMRLQSEDNKAFKYFFTDVSELDICDEEAVMRYVTEHEIDVIVNCAAYTAVDKAEDNVELCDRLNHIAPGYLAKAIRTRGGCLVQISTDYVFDGTAHVPYREDCPTCPASVYGVTKLAGEQEAMAHCPNTMIIRTAWLYSTFGNNFVKTMLRLGAEKEELKVVFDQVGTPTYAAHLAQAVVAVLPRLEAGYKEVFHFSNEGVCSWYDFAEEIMVQGGRNCKVLPIESKDYPTAAERPVFSVLNKAKFKTSFGMEIPHWKKGLEECLKRF